MPTPWIPHFPLLYPFGWLHRDLLFHRKDQLPGAVSSGLIIKIQIPALPLIDCVCDPGKNRFFSESQFLHLQNNDYAPYLLLLVATMKRIMSLEYRAQRLAHTTNPAPSPRPKGLEAQEQSQHQEDGRVHIQDETKAVTLFQGRQHTAGS